VVVSNALISKVTSFAEEFHPNFFQQHGSSLCICRPITVLFNFPQDQGNRVMDTKTVAVHMESSG
jgi:hypothetical protein